MPRKNSNARATVSPAQKRIWRHNSFFGHARMMISQCEGIIHSDSATPEAKSLARAIQANARELTRALKERLDHK